MARIAVVTSHPPFTEGGHMVIARGLVAALRDAGHDADLVLTPQNRFGRQAAAYLATWLTDVGESDGKRVDQVISLRYPAYAVRHPRHVVWLNHTMREYYDLWPGFRARLSPLNRLKEGARRRLIHAADRALLSPRRVRLVAQSQTVARRVREDLGVPADVLHPPPPARAYRSEAYGDEFFVVSRLTPLKRIDLVLRALAEPGGETLTLAVGGVGEEAPRLHALAASLGIGARVRFLGALDESGLLDAYARCRAVVFTPQAEDYGFVTSEAFASGRPVITCTDSGGPTELVRDGVTGLVVPPDPAALAAAMQRLAGDAATAERLGAAARDTASAMSWPAAVSRLTVSG